MEKEIYKVEAKKEEGKIKKNGQVEIWPARWMAEDMYKHFELHKESMDLKLRISLVANALLGFLAISLLMRLL